MKAYLAGPMSGLPDRNYPAFEAAARELRERGLEVVSPHELECSEDTWEAWMATDIKAMLDCEMIVTLDGWENSKGACLEVHIAYSLGKQVMRFTNAARNEVAA